MTNRDAGGYSALQIGLHWTIAAFVAFQLVFGEGMTRVREAAEEGLTPSGGDLALSAAHYWLGIAILVLVVVRVAVRLWKGASLHPSDMPSWMVWAARLNHRAFYAMLVAMPVLGLLTVYVSDEFGEIHTLGKPLFIVLIAIHVAAALYHQFIRKDGALRRMLVPARG
jgi:cytochrome b561